LTRKPNTAGLDAQKQPLSKEQSYKNLLKQASAKNLSGP